MGEPPKFQNPRTRAQNSEPTSHRMNTPFTFFFPDVHSDARTHTFPHPESTHRNDKRHFGPEISPPSGVCRARRVCAPPLSGRLTKDAECPVSNDVSRGRSSSVAIRDVRGMAVSQHAAPGQVSFKLCTRRATSLEESASVVYVFSPCAACGWQCCGLFAAGRCSCLHPAGSKRLHAHHFVCHPGPRDTHPPRFSTS